jgi:hypothetical protein
VKAYSAAVPQTAHFSTHPPPVFLQTVDVPPDAPVRILEHLHPILALTPIIVAPAVILLTAPALLRISTQDPTQDVLDALSLHSRGASSSRCYGGSEDHLSHAPPILMLFDRTQRIRAGSCFPRCDPSTYQSADKLARMPVNSSHNPDGTKASTPSSGVYRHSPRRS